jgi:hypothetical protein
MAACQNVIRDTIEAGEACFVAFEVNPDGRMLTMDTLPSRPNTLVRRRRSGILIPPGGNVDAVPPF